MDGASRLQRIWYISLPGILPDGGVVTLLRLGNILDAGFKQIFVLYSLPVYSVGDIIDTWVYRQGILEFQFSLATAVGLFKGVIGLVLVLVSNRVAKRIRRLRICIDQEIRMLSRFRILGRLFFQSDDKRFSDYRAAGCHYPDVAGVDHVGHAAGLHRQ